MEVRSHAAAADLYELVAVLEDGGAPGEEWAARLAGAASVLGEHRALESRLRSGVLEGGV